jgi:hypothetical protein
MNPNTMVYFEAVQENRRRFEKTVVPESAGQLTDHTIEAREAHFANSLKRLVTASRPIQFFRGTTANHVPSVVKIPGLDFFS